MAQFLSNFLSLFSLLSNFPPLSLSLARSFTLRLCPLSNRILEEILRQLDSFNQSPKRTMPLQCYQMCRLKTVCTGGKTNVCV